MIVRSATWKDIDLLVRVDLDDEGVTPGYRIDWQAEDFERHRTFIGTFVDGPECFANVAEVPEETVIGVVLWRVRSIEEDLPEDHVFKQIPREIFPSDGVFCEIFNLWVDPSWRRQGVATTLKTSVEEFARGRGVRLIYTHTEESNHDVLALNEMLGYFEVRRGPIWDEVVRVSLVKNLEGRDSP